MSDSAVQEKRFAVSRYTGDGDFHRDGMRPYALYRDLGFAEASGGTAQVHVIRMIPPCTDEVRKRHTHATQFQMFYVLKGWTKIEYEGQGTLVFHAGDSAYMPPSIAHTVLDYSDDCEMIEIVLPAEFETVPA